MFRSPRGARFSYSHPAVLWVAVQHQPCAMLFKSVHAVLAYAFENNQYPAHEL